MLIKPPFCQSSSGWVCEGRIVLAKRSQGIILVSIYLLTNQPRIHLDLSLGALTLYLLVTSTLTITPLSIVGTGGHMPSCIGSMVVTILWGSRSASRGNGVSPVLGSWWIHLVNHIPRVLSNRCHTLRQGRLHLGSDNRIRLRWCDPQGVMHIGLKGRVIVSH